MESNTHILLRVSRFVYVCPETLGFKALHNYSIYGVARYYGLYQTRVLCGLFLGGQEKIDPDQEDSGPNRVGEEKTCDFRISIPFHDLIEL
jgi:hypothetical protein